MEPRPEERYIAVNGVELCYFQWGRPGAGTLLLLHATGFHARCWDSVIRALPRAWREGHILALEVRGHGRSDKSGPFDWRSCATDLVGFLDALDLAHVTVAGHSMGGHVAVLAAAARPERFERLVLLDPVILAPQARSRLVMVGTPASHPVARRRNEWPSWRAMYERFEARHPYSLWEPAVLADYCRYGLLPHPDGTGQVLACPPPVEAEFYGHALEDSGIRDAIGAVTRPVTVVRARRRDQRESAEGLDFSSSPTWPELAGAFAEARDLHLEELTHFIPMQDPVRTARLITLPYI